MLAARVGPPNGPSDGEASREEELSNAAPHVPADPLFM
jgi:hypothetical protein